MMTARTYFTGLDLGQAQDPSAIAVLERSLCAFESGRFWWQYAVMMLYRWPLLTPYTRIADDVTAQFTRSALRGSILAVDATGVGRPVVEMLEKKRPQCRLRPVLITSGNTPHNDNGMWHIPKKELATTVMVLLESKRLRIAEGIPEAKILAHELGNFKVRVTIAGNETFEALRENDHDDLVLAVALGAWFGEQERPPAGIPRMISPGPGGGPFAGGINPHG